MILSREDCQKILHKGKILTYFTISKYSDKVCGYLSEQYNLTLFFTDEISGEIGTKMFFFKTLPEKMRSHNEYIENTGVFRKEILMYEDILKDFSMLVSKQFAPTYFHSVTDKCLILEDMRLLGYQSNNEGYLDFDKMKAALGAMARLHAASLIFEEKRSINDAFRMNEHFSEALEEATFIFDESRVRYFWCQTTIKCLEDLRVYFSENTEATKKLRRFFFSEDGFRKFLRPSKKYRNVICHDDLWCNNLLFNDKNNCIIVDFQMTRYTPPVCDVLLALYINLERNDVNQNMNKFLDCYYDFLSNELSLHNISASKVIPKNDFLASAEEYQLPTLLKCGLFGTNVFIPDHLSVEVFSCGESFEKFYLKDRSYYVLKEFKCNEKYRSRFSQVLIPLFEFLEKM